MQMDDVTIHSMPELVEPDFANNKDVRTKATLNYINALTVGLSEEGGSYVNYRLVLEDDVIACANLRKFLEIYLGGINKPDAKAWAISPPLNLYSALIENADAEFGIYLTDLKYFFGTQAILYQERFAFLLADYMKKNIGKEPYDFLLRNFCQQPGYDIATIPTTSHSLFQHIGNVTTGLGFNHEAKNFLGIEKDNVKVIPRMREIETSGRSYKTHSK